MDLINNKIVILVATDACMYPEWIQKLWVVIYRKGRIYKHMSAGSDRQDVRTQCANLSQVRLVGTLGFQERVLKRASL